MLDDLCASGLELNFAFVQLWDAFEGERLFTGYDEEFNAYRSRAHLAEIIALLGPPPPSLVARANLRSKFFDDEGASQTLNVNGSSDCTFLFADHLTSRR